MINSKIILLCGPIASGKSTLTIDLIENYNFTRIRSSDYLKYFAKQENIPCQRQELQKLGDRLDQKPDYKWISDSCYLTVYDKPQKDRWVFEILG